MSAALLFGFLGSILVGAVLFVLGIRGKRINDHPVCRDCRFDLLGVYPDAVTCPECGAGLKRDKAIRTGQRRRRWVMALVGCGMIGVPSLGIGTVGFALLTGTNLNSYKPVGLLLWESRRAGKENCAAAGAELLNRFKASKLDADQVQTVIEATLMLQGNLERPWDSAWGDILETANVKGDLSKEQRLAYYKQAAVFEFEIRPNVRLGAPVPVVGDLVEARIGSSTQLMALVILEDPAVDGLKTKRAKFGGRKNPWYGMDNDQMHMTWIQMYGTSSMFGANVGGRVKLLLDLPKDTGVGRHELTTILRVRTMEQPQGSFTWPDTVNEEDEDTRSTTIELAFNVVAVDARRIDVVQATPDLDQEMADSFSVASAGIWNAGFGASRQVNMSIAFDQLPVAGAFDVFLRSSETEWKLEGFTTGKSADPREQDTWGWGQGENMRYISGELKGFKGTTADLILRPNAKLAEATTDLVQIYGGEVVLKDIEIGSEDLDINTGTGAGLGGWLLKLFTGG